MLLGSGVEKVVNGVHLLGFDKVFLDFSLGIFLGVFFSSLF